MSIITTAQWVPRGFAAPFPKKYTLDEAEYDRIAGLAKLQLDDAQDDLKEAEAKKRKKSRDEEEAGDEMQTDHESRGSDEDVLKEYDLEHYDDDDDDESEAQTKGETMGMFGNVKSLAYYETNDDDPYITLQGDEDEDDGEELQIMATDNLILSAKVEDELAQLEVYVFEDEGDNLYVHHDLMLPAIPLCLEWLDMPVGKQGAAEAATGNFVAVGTMDPDIEIWDLDTIDCMYPNAILGQGGEAEAAKKEAKKAKKKKSKKAANDNYHVDAILSLAANRSHRNLLASASADQTVKLWDVNTTKCAQSYSYHTDKVCSLGWSAAEPTVLLSGSYDGTVVAADMRAPGAKAPRWGVEGDVETVRWDPHDGNMFFVSTDRGAVHYHDVRKAPRSAEATKSVWTLQAHDESVSSFDVNGVIPGLMATGSTDKTVKLWNISAATGPSMVVSRNLDVGKVFAATFAPDAAVAFRLAVAGSSGSMHVWDTSTNAAVRKAFAHRLPGRSETATAAEDRLIGVEDEDGSSSDDGEGPYGEGPYGEEGDSMDES
ncbi:hypothetical protein L249_6778 [Ophiocordyceps polyrhachis-furcata BCC 54312]|uniref:Uncharacterized protein n=1 Tax=Ophiocordyceps polyrhachis-furcata BCC 54312 TaxID=1330021 RepID=A0A367LLT9_9HYPO|nr:hypothetical protein L249_6778 [Ophiocordyceps polyrhachis-furcata BCC 54312]